jgi:hypothetical protein
MNNVVKLDEQRPSASAMTKGEQSDLLKLIRARERLANTMAEERKAELVADLEKQLGRIFDRVPGGGVNSGLRPD